MKISKTDMEHIAHLARLTLSEDELERTTHQIDTILMYVAKLEELDTREVKPTTHVFAVCNAFREDRVQKSLTLHEALFNAPQQNGEMFVVPKIL